MSKSKILVENTINFSWNYILNVRAVERIHHNPNVLLVLELLATFKFPHPTYHENQTMNRVHNFNLKRDKEFIVVVQKSYSFRWLHKIEISPYTLQKTQN